MKPVEMKVHEVILISIDNLGIFDTTGKMSPRTCCFYDNYELYYNYGELICLTLSEGCQSKGIR